ncbi:DNA polymerase/3'-5' exonuclease PolX [Adhaeribacter aerolatus]|uniref:DNA polymerase/3'-5' exonuclease PolX n=1 Tax=Adhaeribacter aerolatus TaxID=670289 RepID=A0A512B389_9BACT|nr:DNA polymerase/3'-5' exonuclease PolX [Adhaeribacter aerolatus]GEO06411.1 DNA polymerase/3'-5' exonuclease PolX [Adhaeribacter aerolatus]
MENKDIVRAFRLATSLMELHDENPFKIRSYTNAVAVLERLESPLVGLTADQLERIEGIGKALAGKIVELSETGSFADLDKFVAATPPGVVEMLRIKGIGPKKIRAIWKDLGVTTTEGLLEACENNQIAALKGFGAKTQETIKNALLYTQESKGKVLYAEIEPLALHLRDYLRQTLNTELVETAGEVRRRLEIIQTLLLVIGQNNPDPVFQALAAVPELTFEEHRSGPFIWRGRENTAGLALEVKIVPDACFTNELFLQTGSEAHLSALFNESECLVQLTRKEKFTSEAAIYERAGLAFVQPEMREGTNEILLARENALPELITEDDLRGILHNHSTYSDGVHTLEQMAVHCRDKGYDYLGICDHSKSAFYANGLQEFRVKEQHREIEKLNRQLAPFIIFKGIESDILADGSLDYDNAVLATFDFVVASIHSNLKMDITKATNRLIGAIENPYTTILGHPTGRLLLRREGYPIDHKAVIDACAEHEVIIEINSNPWRLDLDWRWVEYALAKGVKLSLNPDAHSMAGYDDMRYGVFMGRKGGLTREMTFNAWSAEAVASHFEARKKRAVEILAS